RSSGARLAEVPTAPPRDFTTLINVDSTPCDVLPHIAVGSCARARAVASFCCTWSSRGVSRLQPDGRERSTVTDGHRLDEQRIQPVPSGFAGGTHVMRSGAWPGTAGTVAPAP